MTELVKGQTVRIVGERGVYTVYRVDPDRDGSILLYGGDSNPNGVRYFKSVMPDKIVVETSRRRKV